MVKPRLIILVRHAQSEGNKNREIHQSIPDHRVKLTPLGWQQAHDAGRRLREMLRPDDTLHFFTSPYRRTRETTEGILSSLTAPSPDGDGDGDGDGTAEAGAAAAAAEQRPSPFARDKIKVYEEPRLREQDFGNFQPCSAEMERMWQERADYGHFFYRIPNGESAADAYDRISGFNESLWRQFGEDDFASVCVLVTHGLMSRVFLMKWYHFTVEYFEDLRNVNHCEFLIMRKQEDTGKYLLENKLRTWSELRRERAEREKDKDKDKDKDKEQAAAAAAAAAASKLERTKTFVVTRRWGGCPNGCNHGSHYKRRDDLEVLRQRDINGDGAADPQDSPAGNLNGASPAAAASSQTGPSIAVRRLQQRHSQQQQQHSCISSDDDSIPGEPSSAGIDTPDTGVDAAVVAAAAAAAAAAGPAGGPRIDVTRAVEEIVSSPDGTPSFISPENRILKSPHFFNVGRDFGGSYSGVQSLANSDAELSEDDHPRHHHHHHHHSSSSSHRRAPAPRSNGNGASSGGALGGGRGHVEVAVTSLEQTLVSDAGMAVGARANRLGDAPHASDVGSDGDVEDEVSRLEREERSVQGSVY